MQVVPLQPIANQSLQITLAGQPCTINLWQTAYGMFMTLLVNGVIIISTVPCENLNRIVRGIYLGFTGDFAFLDLQGSSDPVYTGLGSRFVLLYLAPNEVPASEG